MKMTAWQCICPVCTYHFSAFMADCINPRRDVTDPSKRSLLCSNCERAFILALYAALQAEGVDSRGLALSCLNLSALPRKTQRAGESGREATIGTDQPSGLFSGLQGMHPQDRDEGVSRGVSSVMDAPHETLRGPTVLPAEPPE